MSRLIFLSKVIVTLFAISLFGAINKVVNREANDELITLNQLERALISCNNAQNKLLEIRDRSFYNDDDPGLDNEFDSQNANAKDELSDQLLANGFTADDLKKFRSPQRKDKIKRHRFSLLAYEVVKPLNKEALYRGNTSALDADSIADEEETADKNDSINYIEASPVGELIRRYRADKIRVTVVKDFNSEQFHSGLAAVITKSKIDILTRLSSENGLTGELGPTGHFTLINDFKLYFNNIRLYKNTARIAFYIAVKSRLSSKRGVPASAVLPSGLDKLYERKEINAFEFPVNTVYAYTNSYYLLSGESDPDKAKHIENSYIINKLDTLYGEKTVADAKKQIGKNIESSEENVDVIGFKVSAFALPFITYSLEFMLSALIIISVYYVHKTGGEKIAEEDKKDWIFPLIIFPFFRATLLILIPALTLYFVFPVYQIPISNNIAFILVGSVSIAVNIGSVIFTYLTPRTKEQEIY